MVSTPTHFNVTSALFSINMSAMPACPLWWRKSAKYTSEYTHSWHTAIHQRNTDKLQTDPTRVVEWGKARRTHCVRVDLHLPLGVRQQQLHYGLPTAIACHGKRGDAMLVTESSVQGRCLCLRGEMGLDDRSDVHPVPAEACGYQGTAALRFVDRAPYFTICLPLPVCTLAEVSDYPELLRR